MRELLALEKSVGIGKEREEDGEGRERIEKPGPGRRVFIGLARTKRTIDCHAMTAIKHPRAAVRSGRDALVPKMGDNVGPIVLPLHRECGRTIGVPGF